MAKITPQILSEEFRARYCLENQKNTETIERLRIMIRALENQCEQSLVNNECPICGHLAFPLDRYCAHCGRKFKGRSLI